MAPSHILNSVDPYVDPETLAGPILGDPLPFDIEILEQSVDRAVSCTGLRFLTEIYKDEKIYMHGWLCTPVEDGNATEPAGKVLPLLVIPGGIGNIEKTTPIWIANQAPMVLLAVDWIGSGRSSALPDMNPWSNAMRFKGTDYRGSYQYHNLRALLRAIKFLLSQPTADGKRLAVMGGSWGGFYSWLLAGLDPRVRYLFPTFGCGCLDTEANQVWESFFASMGLKHAEQWLRAFDPGRRAHLIEGEVFYQHATNDKFYSLVAAMKTYHRVRSKKRLLLIRNQDHSTNPYVGQDVKTLKAICEGAADQMPVVEDANWVHGTNQVQVLARDPERMKLSVKYSFGNYSKSFGRWWRSADAVERDRCWIAEVPVADVHREVWFYGHADDVESKLAASTAVKRIIPAEMGLTEPTTSFDPQFDFASDSFHELPVGDRVHPEMSLVAEEDGITALSMRFRSDLTRRGIAYCLDGDLIAQLGYNAIEVMVKVPEKEHLVGLKLVLVTDFHSLREQTYGVDLQHYGFDGDGYQLLQVPFSDFKPCPHRHYWFWQPPQLPMDVSRLCGVGFYHDDRDYRGEARMARIRTFHLQGAPSITLSSPHQWPWPPREAILNEPDPLAVTGQGVIRGHEMSDNGQGVPGKERVTRRPEAESTSAPPKEAADLARVPDNERPPGVGEYEFYVKTALSPHELRERLRQWEPWRHKITFSNGVSTTEFKTREPFTPEPLAKWHVFKNRIPESALRGGRLLDVGSNCGYFSLEFRQRYNMDVVGVDFHRPNIAVAEFLVEQSGLDRIRFLQADANTFRIDEQFDLVLHFGTLDHLKHPLLALENTAAMLVRDGYLALELQTYKDPVDETLCKFIGKDFKGDSSCWWFPGKQALIEMLETSGFDRIEVLHEWSSPERIGADMRRLRVLARKR